MAKKFSLNLIISWILKFLLILLFPYLIYKKYYLFAIAAIAAIIISFIPVILKRNYKVAIPWELDFLITLALYLHTAGVAFRLYDKIVYWDVITHLISTIVIALLAFIGVYTLNFTGKVKLTIPMIGFFTVIFAIAVGALWEVGEFFCDMFLGTTAQDGLTDTMWDLIFDTIAGIVTALAGMFYVKYHNKKKPFKTE